MKDYEEKVINIMDNTKVNIIAQLNRAYKSGYEDAKSELGKNVIDLAHEKNDRAYQQGLDDAWEAARKIQLDKGLSMRELRQIFGTRYTSRILKENTAQEAIAKIKFFNQEYEEQQKQFAVGDEVYSDAFDDKGIITHITADKVSCVCIICNGSTMMKVGTNDLHKTGRTFPQIVEVLDEMRGESE